MEKYRLYWLAVTKISFNNTYKWLGVKGILVGFVFSAISAYFIDKPTTFSDIGWSEMLLTINIFFTVFFIVFVWFLMKVPVLIDEEQKKEINNLLPSSLNIDIWKLDIKTIKEGRKKRKYLTFEAYNKNPHSTIEDFTIQLRTIIHYSVGDNNKLYSQPFVPLSLLLWDNKEEEVSIRPQKAAIFYLAEIDNRTNAISFGQNNIQDSLFKKESVFQLVLTISGRLEGETKYKVNNCYKTIYSHPIKERIFTGNDAYQKFEDIPQALKERLIRARSGHAY